MRRMRFYNNNRSGNILHIETEGCIVNIRVGLTNAGGQEVTSVEIIPDGYKGEPNWTVDGCRNNRIIKDVAGEEVDS